MGRLFGTDGIRGIANVDLTPTLAYDLGRAVGYLLDGEGLSVVAGQFTRRSGDMLVAALAAGLTSVGSDVVELGVVTTPCLTFQAESLPNVPNPRLGRVAAGSNVIDAYRAHLVDAAGDALAGLRIAVDCANGSASAVAPQ